MATENWWGSHTGPTHAANPGGTGDPVSNYVDFAGFAAVSPMPLPDALPGPVTPPTWTTVSSNITANTTWYCGQQPLHRHGRHRGQRGDQADHPAGGRRQVRGRQEADRQRHPERDRQRRVAHHLHLDQGRPRGRRQRRRRGQLSQARRLGRHHLRGQQRGRAHQAPVRRGALCGQRRLRRADRRRVAGHQRRPDQRQQRLRLAGAQLRRAAGQPQLDPGQSRAAGSSWRPPRRRRSPTTRSGATAAMRSTWTPPATPH